MHLIQVFPDFTSLLGYYWTEVQNHALLSRDSWPSINKNLFHLPAAREPLVLLLWDLSEVPLVPQASRKQEKQRRFLETERTPHSRFDKWLSC